MKNRNGRRTAGEAAGSPSLSSKIEEPSHSVTHFFVHNGTPRPGSDASRKRYTAYISTTRYSVTHRFASPLFSVHSSRSACERPIKISKLRGFASAPPSSTPPPHPPLANSSDSPKVKAIQQINPISRSIRLSRLIEFSRFIGTLRIRRRHCLHLSSGPPDRK